MGLSIQPANISQELNEIRKNPNSGAYKVAAADNLYLQASAGKALDQQDSDQFTAYADSILAQVKNNKFNNIGRTLHNREYTNFFKIFEAGFALMDQWSSMEANVA